MKEKIAVFTTSDISKVQGSTEPYYVSKSLATEYEAHLYSPTNPNIEGLIHHQIPDCKKIPTLILYNIILLPFFLYHSIKHEYEYIYTYKGFHFSSVLISWVIESEWIVDFRTKPTEQDKEWRELSNEMSFFEIIYYQCLDYVYKITLPYAKAVITLSVPIQNDLVESYGVKSEKICLVPLGVDADKFKPSIVKKTQKNPIDIVYMGSITSRRNIEILIDAISDRGLKTKIRLHIIGDGPEEYIKKLKDDISNSNVSEKVTWHGYVNHDDVPHTLDKMDVAVSPLPAHDSYEVSSPAKMYEYLAMGLPILCTDIRAHRHLLTDEQTGFYFRPESVPSLVKAINKIGRLRQNEWIEIQRAARKLGEDNDWSKRLEKIHAVVEE